MKDMKKSLKKSLKNRAIVVFTILLCGVGNGAASQDKTIATNLAEWAYLVTINGSIRYSVAKHYSLEAKIKWNPFSFNKGGSSRVQHKQFAISGGAHYWPWFVNSGWFISSNICFNKFGFAGVKSKKSYEGNAVGVCVGGGYALMLNRRLNLEMGLGTFLGGAKYTKYSCARCGLVEKKKRSFVFAPSDVLLQLSYVF